jgi:hypothetical protein
MQSPQLIQTLSQIASDFRRGDLDVAYQGYRDLFNNPAFNERSPEERRTALRQLIYTQGTPAQLTRSMRNAYDAALTPLQALIAEQGDPADREMLRVCKQRLE